MDDADLAGPLLFIICFGIFLLFVCEYFLTLEDVNMILLDSPENLNSATSMVSDYWALPQYTPC